tara:strand:+ start:3668 stop:4261 length:594 start_codon:yes stop_codon:yes gene_type:complete
MITKKAKSNFFLFIVILLSIIFYFYHISQNKGSIKIEKQQSNNIKKNNLVEKNVTKFTNVEYKTSDDSGRSYITKGKEAYLNKDQPNLIKLNKVESFTKLKDGSILNVMADKANYFKKTKNIKYYQNVKIINKDGVIKADIANFLADKNLIRLEKNVIYNDKKNTVKGDVAELNTITNNLEIFMLKKKDRVYGKRNQ